jgi:hypothetical protein
MPEELMMTEAPSGMKSKRSATKLACRTNPASSSPKKAPRVAEPT